MSRASDLGLVSDILELVSTIPVQAGGLIAEPRDKDIEFTVAIKICEICRHVSVVLSERPKPSAGRNPHFLKSAVVPVVVQEIPPRVIGHEEIGPAVVVVVAPHNAHAVEFVGIIYARLLGYILECTVSAIAKQEVCFSFHVIRQLDKGAFVTEGLRGVRKMMDIGVNVASDEQVEEPISIIVGPGCAGTEAANLEAGFLRHVLESAATKIVIEHVVTVTGHV